MTTTYLPEVDFIIRQLQATKMSLRELINGQPEPQVVTEMTACRGTPEGRFGDPPSSLRFDFTGPSLWFKTTPVGVLTGWQQVAIGSGPGVTPTWAQVLAAGASSGPNSPVVIAGQTLSFGDVPFGQTVAGQVNIGGTLVPTGAFDLGTNANRWNNAYINHLFGLYTDTLPAGSTFSNQFVIDTTGGDDYTLPSAAQNGSLFIVRNRDGVATTTITPQPGDTIEGLPSLDLGPGVAYLFVADNPTTWRAIAMATGGGPVTLQTAITNQGAVPTTQVTSTNIRIGDGLAWNFGDAGGTAVVSIAGDNSASAFVVQGGNTAGGAGQAVSIAAGTATVATQNGGALSISSGTGNTSGTGGLLSVIAGAGGATGVGGTVLVRGGAGGATSGNAGGVTIQGGVPVDGNGGTIAIAASAGVGANRSGGNLIVTAGDATGSGTGGSVAISAGSGGATGTAGPLAITGGAAGSASGASGAVTVSTQPTVSGASGSITITTGNATGGAAGDVVLRGGTGTTTNGRVLVQPVWAGDDESLAIVGNGANGATSGFHAGTRSPNGLVTGHRGALYLRNPGGVGTAGSAFINTSTSDTGTVWSQIVTGTGGTVTLQAALDGQNVLGVPTTQAYTTRIQFADTFGWSFEDAGGTPIVQIAGDGGATAVAITGGNTSPAGAGQAISIAAGTATTATQNGGALSLVSGTGNTTGTGGLLSVIAGAGGATGTGGTLLMRGGPGGATSGNAGGVTVTGGIPVDGNGGAATFSGSAGVGTDRSGGAVIVSAGAATGAGVGGSLSISAGGGGATGTAGAVAITGGAAGSASGASGAVTVSTQPTVAGASGSITLTTGNAAGGVAGNVVFRGGTGTTNGRVLVQPVWAGDAQAFAIVGNGASSATAGLHTSSRVGGPNGVVSGNPGDLLLWNPGVATPGTVYVNVSTTDPGTVWAELINANTTVLAGLPGNIYENLVGYIDSADRNSYPGTGTTVVDIMRNATAGTLTTATQDDGAFTWAGTTGALTFTKNAALDNLFTGGGTVIAFIRPVNAGENNQGRISDTTASGDAGWFLSVNTAASSRVGLTFQRNFNAGAADGGQWTANSVTDPWSGASVLPVQEGSWSCVAVTYDDGSTANVPIFYVNGQVTGTTQTIAPTGTAITDVGNALLVANRTADDRTFNGSISIVLYFDRILSQSEITDVYNLFGRRYGTGQTGFVATVGIGQNTQIVGGPSATNNIPAGSVLVAGGEQSSAAGSAQGGDVAIRGGALTGNQTGRPGNLIVLSGAATSSASGATASSAEFGCGVHNNGNTAGTCTIHAGDNSDQGDGGAMIVRGGDCITATATNDNGGSLGLRAGNSRNGTQGASTFIASGGIFNGTASSTGDINISTTRAAFGPFAASGGANTDTGAITIDTQGGGATSDTSGNITIRCGDVAVTSGANPGDISIQAGAATNTTQANATAGGVSIVGGANAGGTGSIGGSITLTAGASSGTGANTGTGGDITLTAGAMAHNSAASRGGNISGTAGSATGTNGTGGSISFTAGASTGTGTPGSATITAGAGGGAVAGGTASLSGGVGGATGAGGVVNITGGAGGATSGNGGQVNITGGSATDGVGGAVIITGANGAGTNRAGGAARVIAGNGIGTAGGGGAALTGGNGGATGAGGDATITSGNGGGTSGASGNIVLLAGTVTSGTQGELRYTQGSGTRTATTSFLAWATQTFQTTNATPFVVTLHTLSADGRYVRITFDIEGMQGTTANVIAGTFVFTAYRSGGTVTLLASNVSEIQAIGFGVNPTIVLGVSGNDVIATITGIAATTINWSWSGNKQEGGA